MKLFPGAQPRELARAMVLGATLLAELAVFSDHPWSLGGAAVGLFSSGSVTLFGFAAAVALLDPLSRRQARGEEATRWLPVKKDSMELVKETMQVAMVQALFIVYGTLYATERLEDADPNPQELLLLGLRAEPAALAGMACSMLARVETLWGENPGVLGADIGTFAARKTSQNALLEAVRHLDKATDLYRTLPTVDPSTLRPVVQASITAKRFMAQVVAANSTIRRSGGTGTEGRAAHGMLAVVVRRLAEQLLVAFALLHGLDHCPDSSQT